MRTALLLTLAGSVAAAAPAHAGTVDLWQTYEGPERPRAEVGRVGVRDPGVHIVSFDGRALARYADWGSLQLEVLPGIHELGVVYEKGSLAPGRVPIGILYGSVAKSTSTKIVTLDAQPGRFYIVDPHLASGAWAPVIEERPAAAGAKVKRTEGCWELTTIGELESFTSKLVRLVLPSGERVEFKILGFTEPYDSKRLKLKQTMGVVTTCHAGIARRLIIQE